MFFSIGVTFHAVLEIPNPFLHMFFTDFCFIVLMAAIAGIGCKTRGMTGDAGCSITMIQWEGMLPVEFRGGPGRRAMAYRALCSKLTGVRDGFLMTGYTGGA
jgi:hypothetical protein